jgi:hypothetical protein
MRRRRWQMEILHVFGSMRHRKNDGSLALIVRRAVYTRHVVHGDFRGNSSLPDTVNIQRRHVLASLETFKGSHSSIEHEGRIALRSLDAQIDATKKILKKYSILIITF